MNSQIFSLAGGEISRRLWSRSDLERYFASVASLENWMVLPYGGITRRPGFQHIDRWSSSAIRLIPFRFSSSTAFVLAFGNNKMRVYSNGQVVKANDAPLEIVTPYATADLAELRYEQILDVVFLTHPNYAPRRLFRASDTSWTLEEFALTAQPFMDENTTAVTVTPSGTSGTVTLTASVATWETTHVGAHWRIGHIRSTNTVGVDITATGQSSSLLVAGDFSLITSGTWSGEVALQSSPDNSTWTTVQSWEGKNDRQIHFIGTNPEPLYLRVAVTALTSSTGTPRISLDAYEPIVWGSVRITARASATEVTATVVEPLLSTGATTYWAEGSWSARNGYPRQVLLHDARLFFAGTKREPLTLFGSAVDEYDNFRRQADSPDLGLQVRLYSATADRIQWLASRAGAIIVGTAGDEWIVQNASDPEAVTAQKATAYGSAALFAASLNDSLIFVERRGTRIRDYIGIDARDDLARDPYSAGDLTLVAEHITRAGISELAVSQQPDPIIWCVVDGDLVGLNYDRAQSIMGWHRHTTAGRIHSVAVIPGALGDEVWISVDRGVNDWRVERLHPETPTAALEERAADCLYCDSGLVISQASSATVTGLSHHPDGTVLAVLVDGGEHPNVTVAAGAITLQRAATKVCVGLPMTSEVATLPLVAQTQRGMTRYRLGRIAKTTVDLYGTFGLEYADAERGVWYPLQQRLATDNPDLPPPLRTGPVEVSVAGGYSTTPRLKFRAANPLPATILGLAVEWDSTQTV